MFQLPVFLPAYQILLILDSLPQRLPQYKLNEILQFRINGSPRRISEHRLHPGHQHLEALYHSDHFDHRELFFRCVVVSGSLKQNLFNYTIKSFCLGNFKV